MATADESLRRLLTTLLALEGIGPHLRRAIRRALVRGEPERMQPLARVVTAELLRRGELVRVAVDGTTTLAGPLCLIKSTAELLDLSPLQARVVRRAPVRERRARPAGPADRIAPTRFESVDQVLVAMEQAQNLRIGDPQSGQRVVILESILSLLTRFLSGLELFILLSGEEGMAPVGGRLFLADSERSEPLWLKVRARGAEVWITGRSELPVEIRQQSQRAAAAAAGSVSEAEPVFQPSPAVPLFGPDWTGELETRADHEVGLLFVVPQSPWQQADLLRMGRRLSRFVTRRWQHQQDVNQRIHTDSLTGVCNRAFFDSQFTQELERAKRRKSAMTLLLADLDHFKAVNDRFGHQAGDLVLQRVAHELQQSLRRIDHVCRIGGEEFALILPDTSAEAAQEVVARILTRLAGVRHRAPAGGEEFGVTLSLGAVTFPEGGEDAFELYRKADAMLYRSKNMGRNRCSYWVPNGEPLTLLPASAPD